MLPQRRLHARREEPLGIADRYDDRQVRKLDLVVTNLLDNTVSVLIGNGDGTFRWAPGGGDFGFDQGWRVDRHPRFLADVTGDGRQDLILLSQDRVLIYPQDDGQGEAPSTAGGER
jgi:hypothetical protein